MEREIRQPSAGSVRSEIERLLDRLSSFGVGSIPDVTSSADERLTDLQALASVLDSLKLMVSELEQSNVIPEATPTKPRLEVFVSNSNWGVRAV